MFPFISINLQKVFLPKEYDALSRKNDIALLELETAIVFDAEVCKNIKPARLWEHDSSDKEEKAMIVIGFGRNGTKGWMKICYKP